MTPYGRFESKDWFCNRKRSNDIFEIYVLSYNILHLQNVREPNYCKLTVGREGNVATTASIVLYIQASIWERFIKVYMTQNCLFPSWKDLLKLYNNFFCSF